MLHPLYYALLTHQLSSAPAAYSSAADTIDAAPQSPDRTSDPPSHAQLRAEGPWRGLAIGQPHHLTSPSSTNPLLKISLLLLEEKPRIVH